MQAYQKMNPYIYYTITIVLYLLVIVGAAFVKDLASLFDYLAALSISGIQFFVPGLCYI